MNAAIMPDTGAIRTRNLALATWVSAINFWAWNMIGPLSTTYAAHLSLSSAEASVLVATPILVGSLGRIVVGALTDDLGAAAARRPHGAGAAVLLHPRDHRAHPVLPVAIHPVGARVQCADRVIVPALHRLPQPRRGHQERTCGPAAAPARLVIADSRVSVAAVPDHLTVGA